MFQDGMTSLCGAAKEGNVDVVKLLLENSAYMNIQDKVNLNLSSFPSFLNNLLNNNSLILSLLYVMPYFKPVTSGLPL